MSIDKKDEKRFKTIVNDGLGASRLSKVSVGDIVCWSSWCLSVEEETFEERSGLLVEVIKDTRLSGWAYVGKILQFGTGEYVFIPLVSLNKITKEN